jgi:hypothetical protein
MTSQQIHKLVLYPLSIDFVLSAWDGLVDELQAVEFLGEPLAGENRKRFLAGERFLQYITFMGCSPSVELTAPADGSLDFCHVRLSELYEHPQFRGASQNVFARCPQCRKRISNWDHALSAWRIDSRATSFQCDQCGAQVSLYDLGWRHTAGFARLFLDVYSIYPQEGIPTDQFLSLLETQTGVPWSYFFTDS